VLTSAQEENDENKKEECLLVWQWLPVVGKTFTQNLTPVKKFKGSLNRANSWRTKKNLHTCFQVVG
jgi:hypothetical protein